MHRDEVLAEVADRIGPRSVVKPARLGSSLGMTLVHEPGELPAAIDEALRYDSKVIVEAYLAHARELECGVLGNDDPIVFEPGEVRSHREWYDYAAKYTAGLADVLPRAEVEPALAERLKELALAAYRAVDCAGFARVDFLVPDGAVYISEMNTIPGFTTTSMFPKQAELAGIGFSRAHRSADRAGPGARPGPAGVRTMSATALRPRRRSGGHARRPGTPLRRRVRARLPSAGRILAVLLFASAVAGLVTLVNGPWLRVTAAVHDGRPLHLRRRPGRDHGRLPWRVRC